MVSTLVPSSLPSPVEAEEAGAQVSDGNTNRRDGFGGGNFHDSGNGPQEGSETNPDRWATPASAYLTVVVFIIFSVLSVFATLTHVLQSRWVHSKDWVSISLPPALYVNTAILLLSSVTIELARVSLEGRNRARWLVITFLLGLLFVGGQLIVWRTLISGGLYFASNPGSFFFYLITAAHGIHLAGGILALAYIVLFKSHLVRTGGQKTAVGSVALYWHFMDALWLYVLALLFFTIQR